MAERKVQNKYYPPEYFEALERNGGRGASLNAFRGQHPLRERARKLDQGILVVRFEMPFNVWCLKCERHIATGVRFNAEKKQVGSYFSSKIWSFRMRCPSCSNQMEMRSDPQHSDYVCVEGCRRKIETWEEEGAQFLDPEEAQRIAKDPLYRLEHEQEDNIKAQTLKPVIVSLQEIQQKKHDDYALSQKLRRRFREQKKEIIAKEVASFHKGLQMHLVDEHEEDINVAKRIRFNPNSAQINLSIARSSSAIVGSTNDNCSASSSNISSACAAANGDMKPNTTMAALLKRVIAASAQSHPNDNTQSMSLRSQNDAGTLTNSNHTHPTVKMPSTSLNAEHSEPHPKSAALSLLKQYNTS